MMRRQTRPRLPELPAGEARLPSDFPARLLALKQEGGLTWEAMAYALAVDTRQLLRWRRGASPSGGAMLALVRLATQVPGGMALLMGEELTLGERTTD